MPIFEYLCDDCGTKFEQLVRNRASNDVLCPSCGENHVTTQFVLHKCPNGLTGYKCHFDYPYFFAVNGSSGQIAACQSGL